MRLTLPVGFGRHRHLIDRRERADHFDARRTVSWRTASTLTGLAAVSRPRACAVSVFEQPRREQRQTRQSPARDDLRSTHQFMWSDPWSDRNPISIRRAQNPDCLRRRFDAAYAQVRRRAGAARCAITDSELSVIAALAQIGLISRPEERIQHAGRDRDAERCCRRTPETGSGECCGASRATAGARGRCRAGRP